MTDSNKKNVLVVGAGGFVGGFAVAEGLRRGYNVTAGLRASTSRRFLTDPRINFVELDFENPETLADALKNALPEGQKWQYIIYNLGATKALRFADFSRINCDYLRSFTDALVAADIVPDKLLYMSSLSVMGIGDEKGFTPFDEKMVPQPVTRYGASKLKAEMHLAMSGIPHIILRPTGVYGPRDKDYYLMFKSIAKGLDTSVGYRKQLLSFIYVEDLCAAMYDALENAPDGNAYLLAENRGYTQKEFRKMVSDALGRKFTLPLRLPLWMAKLACFVCGKWGVAMMKPQTLNPDKYKILKQRNWLVNTEKAQRDFGFSAPTDLHTGVRKCVEYYRSEKML